MLGEELMKLSDIISGVLLSLLVSYGAFAAPKIDSITVESNDTYKNNDLITVKGLSFIANADNPQLTAVPILWDRTSIVYQKGVPTEYYKTYPEAAPVSRPAGVAGADPKSLWAKSSVLHTTGSEPSTPPLITHGVRAPRYEGGPSHYYVLGANGYLGWPMAYGGTTTPAPDTAEGSNQMYISWWYKAKYSTTTYAVFNVEQLDGAFSEGDQFVLEGAKYPITGSVVNFDGTTIHVVFKSPNEKDARYYAAGNPAVGLTFVKDTELSSTKAASGVFAAPYFGFGANKFIRVWDEHDYREPSRTLTSWTNDTLKMDDGVNPSKFINKMWQGIDNEWNHMEMEFNFNGGALKVWVNSALEYEIDLSEVPPVNSKDHSPTIGLLGFNGKTQLYQESDFGDIYFNNKLNRILVADKPLWSQIEQEGGHTELQYPVSWEESSLTFKVYKGSFSQLNGLYLYILDENGVPNEKGFQIPGTAAPKAPVIL